VPTRRETLFHPSGAGPSIVAEAPLQMIRAPAQLVSRRSILPTGNLATCADRPGFPSPRLGTTMLKDTKH
jgi:hypothetical protein